ncbi:hypothetical protein RJ641_022499 [Dillenia turbinata]|uniref:Nudix hydrolase domain-containing protein n=1 Tax=Dillenia turbinata TaxID=194707 RepID=A0AAN8ULP5_9MAGN
MRQVRVLSNYIFHLNAKLMLCMCIPCKLIRDDESSLENRIRILMISTPKRDDLVFPKGGWEDDETVREAA